MHLWAVPDRLAVHIGMDLPQERHLEEGCHSNQNLNLLTNQDLKRQICVIYFLFASTLKLIDINETRPVCNLGPLSLAT